MMGTTGQKTILITGGAGYIGSHTARACVAAGRRAVIVDDLSTGDPANLPADVALIKLHLPDGDALKSIIKEHDIGAIMHFAGSLSVPESIRDPLLYYSNNTAMALDVIKAAVDAGVEHFVFSSTAAVYGETNQAQVPEDSPLAPCNPYGTSKRMIEQMLEDISRASSLRSVSLRYFNVAGIAPGTTLLQRGKTPDHLLKAICSVARGEQSQLEIYGDDYDTADGTCVRDFIHVCDLADAHVLALEYLEKGGATDVFNCGYGNGVSVRQMLTAVETELGRTLPVHMAERRPGDPACVVAASEKIREAFGWTPQHDDLAGMVRSALERGDVS